jgi:single-strand DNA-binding protein
MAINNNLTVVGNITRDPELRFTPGGMAVASFGLAWNRRKQDGSEEVSFFDVTCFGDLAENVAESTAKGTRVLVVGNVQQRSWETSDGEKRSKVEILADEVAPSLRWATAAVTKNDKKGDSNRGGGDAATRPVPNEAPKYDDEEPF